MSIEPKNINYDNLFFSKTKHKSTNNFLYVYYDKKPLVLKFPKMRLPFGIKKDTLSQKCQYILDLSFENNDGLLMHCQQIDDFIINKVHKEILQDKTLDEVKSMYISCIKYPQDSNFYPTFRTKIITQNDNKVKCLFYDSQKNKENSYEKIEIESESYLMVYMQKNSHIETILECIGLWMREDKFGLSFKTTQVKLYPKIEYERKEETCEFVDSDESTSDSELDFLN